MDRRQQDQLYEEASRVCGPFLRRLARSYESDSDRRLDLLQDIHVELWRSMARFDHRCSLRTWGFRVANNVGVSHLIQRRRNTERLVSLETLDTSFTSVDGCAQSDIALSAAKLIELIQQLKPVDRQIMVLYLEGESGRTDRRDYEFLCVEHLYQSASYKTAVEPPIYGRSWSCNTGMKTDNFPLI